VSRSSEVGSWVYLRRFVTVISVENGSPAWRKNYLGAVRATSVLDLNEAVDKRVLPHGMSGAGRLPRLHRFFIGAWPTRDPGK
jgi:hypothetical protein